MEQIIPVTPTITNGCAAKTANTRDPRTEERSTSLTPKLMAVFENISKEKANAGRMLHLGLVVRPEISLWYNSEETRCWVFRNKILVRGRAPRSVDAFERANVQAANWSQWIFAENEDSIILRAYFAKYIYTVAGTTL